MPISKCPNGKWKVGNGECKFASKQKAENAFKHYIEASRGEQFTLEYAMDGSKTIYKFPDGNTASLKFLEQQFNRGEAIEVAFEVYDEEKFE